MEVPLQAGAQALDGPASQVVFCRLEADAELTRRVLLDRDQAFFIPEGHEEGCPHSSGRRR